MGPEHGTMGSAVGQEVEEVIHELESGWFDPQLLQALLYVDVSLGKTLTQCH